MPNYRTLLISRWQLMGGILLSAMLVGVLWTTSKVPLYTSRATLLIEEPAPTLPESDDIKIEPARYYQTQIALLNSPSLAAQVITSYQLGFNPVFLDVPKKRAGLNRFFAWLSRRFKGLLSYSLYLFGGTSQVGTATVSSEQVPIPEKSELVSLYLSLLSIKPDLYSPAVDVEFTTPEPALSQELANAHAQTFVRTVQTTRFQLTAEDLSILEQQGASQQQRLTQAQARVQQFSQEHPNIAPPEPGNLTIQRLLDVYRRLTHARERRIEAEMLLRLTKQKDASQFLSLIKNDRVTQLQSTLAKLEAERTRLVTMLSPSNPRIGALNAALKTTQQTIDNERTTLVQSFAAELTAAISAETLLQEEAGQQQKSALGRGDFATVLAALNAEVGSYQTLLESLRQQQQDGAIFKTTANSQVTLSVTAELPVSPVSPQPRQDLLLALLVGFVSAIVCGVIAEWTDTSVRTSQDVWLTTAYPTLGMIPPHASWFELLRAKSWQALQSFTQQSEQKQTETERPPLASREMITANSSLIAPYHVLGTTLPSERRKSPRSLLLTSPLPREGKTVTTLNLAISLAWSDYRVVVVDADLRAGRCHTLLQREKSPGLGEVLLEGVSLEEIRRRIKKKDLGEKSEKTPPGRDRQGRATASDEPQYMRPAQKLKVLIEAAVQTTTIKGLSLMACGRLPIDPTEALASHSMQEILQVLRRQYDYVLVDSPAALASDDATLLARLCDATLLVLRGHKTPMVAAHRVAEQLQSMHANVLGVILVDVDPPTAGAGTTF